MTHELTDKIKIDTSLIPGEVRDRLAAATLEMVRGILRQPGGREALDAYLGSQQEIDFDLVSSILAKFKAGESPISLKRMGRTPEELWFDEVDFTDISVLILEWTHGNSDNVIGVDIPILLNSTPAETLEHRRKRARDKGVDSPFTTMVLELEQTKLHAQAHKAKIIVTKAGDIISFDTYLKLMEAQNG